MSDIKTYNDPFTLDGRVKAPVGVNKVKLGAMKSLVESTLNGDRQAKGKLEEVLSTSDAIFSYSHLTNLNFLPQFERAPRTWRDIAGTRALPDFRKPVLYSIVTEWAGLGREGSNPEGVAPIIPEGAPYPYAYMSGEESQSAGIVKRGFKTDFTFEAFINDAIGFISALPGEMLRVALDTEEYEVYGALLGAGRTAVSQLAGGTTPTGATVTANAPISRDALIRALQELALRKINNRFVQFSGGYNLIVPVGQGIYVQYFLNAVFSEQTTGNPGFIFNIEGYNPLAGVTVVESQYVTGTQWFLIPKSSPRPILEHATLIGHETPELRVENATGTYVGGGAVSPFEGSFDNDSATFRMRQFGAGILWTPSLVLFSRGDSSAVS